MDRNLPWLHMISMFTTVDKQLGERTNNAVKRGGKPLVLP